MHTWPTRTSRAAFTLLEMLVAVALLSMAMTMILTTFYSVTRAWQRGNAVAGSLDHGDYLMLQVVGGMRSAYYPQPGSSARAQTPAPAATNDAATNGAATNAAPAAPYYGFTLEDDGDSPDSQDVISWVKTGPELLMLDDPLARGLHRVRLSVEEGPGGRPAVAVRAWRPYGNPITFDPLEQEPHFISSTVLGLNCRVAWELEDGQWDWLDEWEDELTNCLPLAVEITVFMEAPDPGEPPVELQRTFELPAGPLSWIGKTPPL